MRYALFSLIVGSGLLLAACGDSASPESVIEAYIDAARDGDQEKMNDLVFDKDLETYRQFDNPFGDLKDQDDVYIEMGKLEKEKTEDEEVGRIDYKIWVNDHLKKYGVIVAIKHEGAWKVSRERSTVHEPISGKPDSMP